MNSVFLSHNSDDWSTPSFIYDYFKDLGYFDPCPLFSNGAFKSVWPSKVFCNPPYSLTNDFVNWGCFCACSFPSPSYVFLIPSRTDTRYFKKLYDLGCHFVFLRGRLSFGSKKTCAPFPSVLCLLDFKPSRISVVDKMQLLPFLDSIL